MVSRAVVWSSLGGGRSSSRVVRIGNERCGIVRLWNLFMCSLYSIDLWSSGSEQVGSCWSRVRGRGKVNEKQGGISLCE